MFWEPLPPDYEYKAFALSLAAVGIVMLLGGLNTL